MRSGRTPRAHIALEGDHGVFTGRARSAIPGTATPGTASHEELRLLAVLGGRRLTTNR